MQSELLIFEKIAEGQPISKSEVEAAIKVLEGMMAEAEEKAPPGYVTRLQESIDRIRAYKPKRGRKARPLSEIQKDIEAAQEMVHRYRTARQYDIAAKWEYNRDEYQKEYYAAVKGQMYIPDLKEVGNNDRQYVYTGIQQCI